MRPSIGILNASRQSTLSLNMIVAQEYFLWMIFIFHFLSFLSWWEKTHPHPDGKPSPSQLGTSCLIKSRRYQAAQEKLVTNFLKLGVTIWLIILFSAHWAENAWLVLKLQSQWFLQFPEFQLGSQQSLVPLCTSRCTQDSSQSESFKLQHPGLSLGSNLCYSLHDLEHPQPQITLPTCDVSHQVRSYLQ